MNETLQQLPKIEGFSPDMLWIFFIVGIGLATLFVLGDKVVEVFRKANERRKIKNRDVTDEIAEKVIKELKPTHDERFAQIDKRLDNDKELLELHTRQLNEQKERSDKIENLTRALCHGVLALLEKDPTLAKVSNAMKNCLIDGKYDENDWK